MNNEITLLLARNPAFRFVKVSFGTDRKYYSYKTMEPLEKGDFVVVDTPSQGLKVVEVVEVLELHEVDLNPHYSYKWVVQKVDTTNYEELKARENEAKKHINRAKTSALVAKMEEDMITRIGQESFDKVEKLVRL